jgi:UDP-N-acetylmuramoyl-L-alanyl-D-glutamate--2,6-diaminopimelate ligase
VSTEAPIVTAIAQAGLLADPADSGESIPAAVREAPPRAPLHLTGITDDSRKVTPGSVFIAVRGTAGDGHDFIPKAREMGAALVIAEDFAAMKSGPAIIVKDSRRAAAIAAAAFYRWPARQLRMIAVTGTNGKTTTVGMVRHLLDAATEGSGTSTSSGRAASIGTLGVLVGSEGEPVDGGAGLTTPGPVELQRVLRNLVNAGVTTVAMEVSSHSLAQHRVDGVDFVAAVFTNLTRDHLDYHGTMDAYRDAKLSLADHVMDGGTLVVDAAEPAWKGLKRPGKGVLSFGTSADAHVRAEGVAFHPRGSRFTLTDGEAAANVALPLIGDFNVTNALGAAAAAIALGMPVAHVAARLTTMPQVPGRLEIIGDHPAVLRDYAHTPDALERALMALRPFVPGRLIAVFGAGGDRDTGKRPLMGAAAAKYADVVIITSDNPRTEDPERIIDQIVPGVGAKPYERIEDRRAAIAHAIELANAERDLVLLAGKGHEDYQVRGTTKLPFDEKVIVGEIFAARRAKSAAAAQGQAS